MQVVPGMLCARAFDVLSQQGRCDTTLGALLKCSAVLQPAHVCKQSRTHQPASWSSINDIPLICFCPVSTLFPAGNTIGWQQQYCREVNEQYICTAYCAPGYKQGSDGLPSSSCDVMTGEWTDVGGSCTPDQGGGGGCSKLPTQTPPKNSLGWRTTACYTIGFGPKATTTCYATCDVGYTGSGANGYDPYAVCDWKSGRLAQRPQHNARSSNALA
jgi:hypothetical protein